MLQLLFSRHNVSQWHYWKGVINLPPNPNSHCKFTRDRTYSPGEWLSLDEIYQFAIQTYDLNEPGDAWEAVDPVVTCLLGYNRTIQDVAALIWWCPNRIRSVLNILQWCVNIHSVSVDLMEGKIRTVCDAISLLAPVQTAGVNMEMHTSLCPSATPVEMQQEDLTSYGPSIDKTCSPTRPVNNVSTSELPALPAPHRHN